LKLQSGYALSTFQSAVILIQIDAALSL